MRKGNATRSTITQKALALASELGLEQISIGELAKAVGMSKSGLFAHFQSKESLQLHVLDQAAELFTEKVIKPAIKEARGEPRIRALFEKWLAWERASFMPGGCIFVAAASELDDRPGPLRDHLVSTQESWLSFIAKAAHIAVEEKHFREDLDLGQFAYEFYSLALGYHLLSRLLKDPKAKQRFRNAFEDLLKKSR